MCRVLNASWTLFFVWLIQMYQLLYADRVVVASTMPSAIQANRFPHRVL
jgi:predicted GNAT superfamily acetyltransferase